MTTSIATPSSVRNPLTVSADQSTHWFSLTRQRSTCRAHNTKPNRVRASQGKVHHVSEARSKLVSSAYEWERLVAAWRTLLATTSQIHAQTAARSKVLGGTKGRTVPQSQQGTVESEDVGVWGERS